VGHLVIALRTTLFVDAEAYATGIELLLDGLRAQGTDDAPIVFPGDPELQAREHAGRDGIPISSELAEQLDALAVRLGVLPLRVSRG
jgi:LDH2 family malate/lactate/ureidoglycolate dehydrogenase